MRQTVRFIASLTLLVAAQARAQTTSGLVAIVPCRLMDTRMSAASGFPPPYGAPNFTAGQKRAISVGGAVAAQNPCADKIPATGVTAVAVNITAIQAAGDGFLVVAPGNPQTMPAVSHLNFSASVAAVANATTVGVTRSQFSILSTQGVSVVVDVMGYYTNSGKTGAPVVRGDNTGNGDGVYGSTHAGDSGGAGVSGHGDNGGYGVYGQSSNNHGVHGRSTSSDGVYGTTAGGSGSPAGVKGVGTGSGAYGVYGSSSETAGVRGFGVIGVSGVTIGGGAAVDGSNTGSGLGVSGYSSAGVGVRGASATGVGVRAEGNGGSTTALEIRNGGLRVAGSSPIAFAVDTYANGGSCKDSQDNRLGVIESPLANGHPEAMVFVTQGSGFTSNDEDGHFAPWYFAHAGGNCPNNHWFVVQLNGDLDRGTILNVLIVSR